MGHPVTYITLDDKELRLGERAQKLGLGLFGLGLVLVVVAALLGIFAYGEEGLVHFLRAYLINYAFALSLAVGALFFVLLHHLTRAGWSASMRRWAECLAMTIPLLALLAIPLIVAAWADALYPWTAQIPAEEKAYTLVAEKRPFLNLPFFTLRFIVYFVILGGLAWLMWRHSTRQDETGDLAESKRLGAISAPGMLVYALVVTVFSMDLLMTLEPDWFSTIWGVYFFAGAVLGFVAFMILSLAALHASGKLSSAITREHQHDLGKLMFAFVIFWAYIAFSQFMLQWYATIPEETIFYQRRASAHLEGDAQQWVTLSYILMAGHFFIPLFGILSRWVKLRKGLLCFWAAWLLVFHWIDLYWIVTPSVLYHHGYAATEGAYGTITAGIPFGYAPLDLLLFGGMAALLVGATLLIARRNRLVAIRDPRLQESLHFHQPF